MLLSERVMVRTDERGTRDCKVDWMTLHVIWDSEYTVGALLHVRELLRPVGTEESREPRALEHAGADVHTAR